MKTSTIVANLKKNLIILGLLFLMGNIIAQEKPMGTPYHSEFGLHAGGVTGCGLSYRHWAGNSGIQITVLPPIHSDEIELYSFGLTYLHNFTDKSWLRVFGYLGAHYWDNTHNNEVYTFDPNLGSYIYRDEMQNDKSVNIGFGPGVSFGTKVRVSLMIGYGFYDITEDLSTLPTGEIGLYYNF